MRRKTIRTRTGAYHVTLPIRLVEEFDEALDYTQSRSKKIAELMQMSLTYDGEHLTMYSRREILEYLQFEFEKDSVEDVLIQSLLKLL